MSGKEVLETLDDIIEDSKNYSKEIESIEVIAEYYEKAYRESIGASEFQSNHPQSFFHNGVLIVFVMNPMGYFKTNFKI